MEENSIQVDDANVELSAGTAFAVLANEHEILQTIGDDENFIVYPEIITSVDDENVPPMIHVLLNVPKGDDNAFRNVNDLIGLIRTGEEGEDGTNEILIQSCHDGGTESNELPRLGSCSEHQKEKILEEAAQEAKIAFIQKDEAEDCNQDCIASSQPDSINEPHHFQNNNDDIFHSHDNIEQESDPFDAFVEKVIVTKYKCKFCTLKFNSPQDVQSHIILRHIKPQSKHDDLPANDSMDIDHGSELSPNSSKVKPKPRTRRKFRRPKKFIGRRSDRRYACDWPECEYVARSQVHLRDHRRIHTGERPHRCEWENCGQSFTQASALRTHMRTHTGEKPFSCTWPGCTMTFSQKSNATVHLRTHTQEKPFKCEWPGCEASFALKGNLQDHKKTHIDEKLFSCDHPGCNRRFIKNSQLRKHQLIHSEDTVKRFGCDLCNYRCHRQSDMNSHMKTHTAEKQFSCDICQKKFSRKSHLKKHAEKLHLNENEFGVGIGYAVSTSASILLNENILSEQMDNL